LPDIRTQAHGGVLEIVLCRTAKRNALTQAMYAELAGRMEQAADDGAVRAILFTAEGRDFCAGNDLAEFLGSYDLAPGSAWRRFLDCLPAARKPLLAAVHGNAVGIGMTMLLHFDLVFVEASARLSAPFATLGVAPEAGSSQLLQARIGPLRANEAFLLGRVFGAQEAVQLGLANALAADGQARGAALVAAQAIAALPPQSVRAVLDLQKASFASLADCIDAECRAFMACLRSDETQAILRRRA
jgi:enoyl-CoA hydratase/carnithine racemase